MKNKTKNNKTEKLILVGFDIGKLFPTRKKAQKYLRKCMNTFQSGVKGNRVRFMGYDRTAINPSDIKILDLK